MLPVEENLNRSTVIIQIKIISVLTFPINCITLSIANTASFYMTRNK